MRAGVSGGTGVGASIVAHPLWWGAAWSAVFAAAAIVAVAVPWPAWAWLVLAALLIAPSLVATIVVLTGTPRDHLHSRSTVFGHFFVRYLALVFAFLTWAVSVVLGAAISTSIQVAARGDEDEIVGIGLQLLATVTPVVVALLWLGFVVRCAWFLGRLRGWSELPATSEVPATLLAGRPDLRRVAIGLAHPGLLLVVGVVAGVTALFAPQGEVTLVL
jgi:hypothetical protein